MTENSRSITNMRNVRMLNDCGTVSTTSKAFLCADMVMKFPLNFVYVPHFRLDFCVCLKHKPPKLFFDVVTFCPCTSISITLSKPPYRRASNIFIYFSLSPFHVLILSILLPFSTSMLTNCK